MLLTAEDAVLLLIDLQERLMPVIHNHQAVVARAVRLAEAATLLGVPVRATEQNPAGLGPTVPPLAAYPQGCWPSRRSRRRVIPALPALLPAGVPGRSSWRAVEAHVCVLQTVLDLLAAGHRVVGRRTRPARMMRRTGRPPSTGRRQHGAEIVTSEMVLFEWLRDARHPRFREVGDVDDLQE